MRRLCDRVIVMRRGEILEDRPTAALFAAPEHPYTAELKAAIPLPEIDPGWLAAGRIETGELSTRLSGCRRLFRHKAVLRCDAAKRDA